MLVASECVVLTVVVRKHKSLTTALTFKKKKKKESFLKGWLDVYSVIVQSRYTLPRYNLI